MHQDIWFSARDGVRLYARRYAGSAASKRPLLCLPGLVGNSAHFDILARSLAQNGAEGRTVYSLDLRGRGQSDIGPGGRAPSLLTECEDVLEFMTLSGLQQVAVLGTGHGGQLAIILALLRPASVGAVVFNDSGPEFEMEGMVRLMGQVANLPMPASWADAQVMLRHMQGRQYPRLKDDDWLQLAKVQYLERDGRPAKSYHRCIAASYSLTRGTAYRQAMWPQYAAMGKLPTLVLRGELSDILSLATVARMRDVNPQLELIKVPGQGHPALLHDAQTIGAVAEFLARNDGRDARVDLPLQAVA